MGLLGSYFVEFSSKGGAELRKEFTELKGELDKMVAGGQKVGSDMVVAFDRLKRKVDENRDGAAKATAQMDKFKSALTEVGRVGTVAFAAAEASLLGFVRAGFQGTAEAQYLDYSMKQLSMEIASVFLPVMAEVVDTVQEIADWFRALGGEQQDSLMKWALWIGSIGTILILLPKIVSVVSAMITVFRSLGVAIAFVKALSGDFATVIAAAALTGAVAAGIYAATSGETGKSGSSAKAGAGHRRVTPGTASISTDVAATHRAIQMATLNMGRPSRQAQMLDKLDEQIKQQMRTNQLLERSKSAVGA